MRRNWIFLVFLMLTCLLLGGCGGESAEESGNNSTAATGGSPGTESVDGSTNISTVSEEAEQWSIKGVRSFHFEGPEEGYNTGGTFYHVMDGNIYLFRTEFRMDETGNFLGSDRMCVQIYDSGTQKVSQHILTPEVPGYGDYRIVSAGLTADSEISLKLRERKEDNTPDILVKTDLQGTVLEVADPFPDEALYPWNTDLWSERNVFHLADGRTILSRWDETAQASVLTWFGGENSGQALGRLDGEYAFAFCGGEEDILYCVVGDSLLRWDVKNNTMEELFQLYRNGIKFGDSTGLFLNDEGEFLLCRMTDEVSYVYVLTDQKQENDAEIRLSCVQRPSGIDYIQRLASTFSFTGGIPVVLEKEEETYQEDYRNRILAELTAGKGPEILWLSREDMMLLAEKGALCDLSDMIPEDIKEKMIPAALEIGTVDGKLVGFAPKVEFTSMITCDNVWAEDSWSISDLMALAESTEDLEALASGWNAVMDPTTLLLWVFLTDMEDSPFLDLEQGISHFDSQEFIQLLELCNKYSRHGDTNTDKEECIMMLREGRIAASRVTIYDPIHFAQIMTNHGGDCHVVGFPTSSGSGNYMTAYSFGYLAVNANAEHKEDIAEFFTYLLDYDQQIGEASSGCSVRLDVIRNFDNKYYHSYTKPDGSSWLNEFLDFLENCEPEPAGLEQIKLIIREEVQAYFNGDKNAADVANIIHSRIQLYLDENR